MPLDNNVTDLSGNDSYSCYDPSVVNYRYFGVLWGSAVTVAGTAGNLMTIVAFAVDPRLRTRFNALIVNLALADLLYCSLLQPVSVDSYLHLRWRGGRLWCRVFGLLLFLSNCVSIITLCVIAVGRYLLVERRAAFDRVFSDRGLALLLPATWGLGLASFGPLWPAYAFVPKVCTCSFHRTRGRPYSTVLLFFYFFVGLGCIGFFYLLIYRRVHVAARALVRYRLSHRSSRRKPASSAQGTEEAVTSSCDMSSQWELAINKGGATPETVPEGALTSALDAVRPSPSAKPVGMEELPPALNRAPVTATPAPRAKVSPSSGDDGELKRVTRMCFTVFLCFVFCFVPFLLLNIVDKRNRAPQALHMFCANLTWLNSCINPVLYAIMNRQFRQAYHVLLVKAVTPLACLRRR